MSNLYSWFVQLFKIELKKRKDAYNACTASSDDAYHKLEHIKNQLRIHENEKMTNRLSDNIIFPLEIYAQITKADINSK